MIRPMAPARAALLVVVLALLGCAHPPRPRSDGHSAPPPRVIVVGGGLAGLVAAYELEKRGIVTELFEATELWGGRVATARYGDDLYGEYGMQEMWADNPLIEISRELGVALDEKVEEPYSSLVLDGKLYPFVQDTVEAFFASFLSAEERRALERWKAQAEAQRQVLRSRGAQAPELAALKDQSFADWVGTFGLPKRVEAWIRITIECELGTDWRSFSGAIGLDEFRFFLGRGQPNYHVRGGNGRLVAALVAAIRGPKHLSSTVTSIERTPSGRLRVGYFSQQEARASEAERVVVAVPFWRLHQIRFDPPLSPEKSPALSSLKRGQYTVVHLLVDQSARALWQVGDASPFPVLTDGTLGVVYGVMHPSPATVPLEVFSLLVHGEAAAEFHMVPRETKLAEIDEALDHLWPGLSRSVRARHVYSYHPAALPVWRPGRAPDDAQGRALRTPEGGVHLIGDYTVSGHANGAAESGLAVAASIARELGR